VQAARLLVHAAASAYDAGVRPTTQVAAMAKLMATEVAQEAVDAAVQFHGAAALQRGHLLERLYREVRAPRIYEGASEIQREIIARGLFRAREGGR
jgi:alkylation response protein AidB-like acyl-CoA dehydrogenase